MIIIVLTEYDDDNETEVDQTIFGPFSSDEEAFSFGEKKLAEYEGEHSIGWYRTILQTP